MLFILLALISVPILEILLLIEVSDRIGAWNALSMVIVSAFLGIWLTKREGRQVLFQLRKDTGRGVLPAESLLHGILVFVGGILLIIPGFITDIMGLSLLVPAARAWVANKLKQALQKSMREGKFQVHTFSNGSQGGGFHAYRATGDFNAFNHEEKEIREAKVIDIETKRLERIHQSEPRQP